MAFWAGHRTNSLATAVMVTIGMSLSLAAFVAMRDNGHQAKEAHLERQVAQLHDFLQERVDSYGLLMGALRAPFSGSLEVSRDDFAAAVRPLLPLFPSLRSIAWLGRVRRADGPDPERTMRATGMAGLDARGHSGPMVADAGLADAMFVTLLMEPEHHATPGALVNGPGGIALGVDVASLPQQRAVLERACASRALTASGALDAPGDAADGRSIALYLPVYRGDAEPPRVGVGPCAGLVGYMGAVFAVEPFLLRAVGRVGEVGGAVYLLDRSAPEGERLLASSARDSHAAASLSRDERRIGNGRRYDRELTVAGRRWDLLLVAPRDALVTESDLSALAVLTFGVLITIGLAGYLRSEGEVKRVLQVEARARAEISRALRESEERFRLALRHSRVSVFSQDRKLRYAWMYNPQTPHSAESFIDRTDADLFEPDDALKLNALKRSVLETGVGSRREVRLTLDGQTQVLDLIVEPLRDDGGAIVGIICAAIEISEASRIREQLAEAHAEAERANQAKSRFLAAASHDLRQPFQAMSLFHHILSAKLTDQKQQEIAAKLGEALGAGNALLSTLLDSSALEAGSIVPRPAVFPLQDVADRLASEVGEQATRKGLALRVVATSALVESDPVLLERVVRNLLVNALRYTVSGRILLGCRRRGDQLAIEVWDTGPGIAADQVERIFEDFYRCGTDQRDSVRGLGLGLSIVRRTAQILGHPVGVRSQPGKGTVFSITVPLIGTRRSADVAGIEPPEEPARAAASC